MAAGPDTGWLAMIFKQLWRPVMPNKQVTKCNVKSLFFLVVVLAVILTIPISAQAQTSGNRVPLTHETMWMLKRVGAPIPSPD